VCREYANAISGKQDTLFLPPAEISSAPATGGHETASNSSSTALRD